MILPRQRRQGGSPGSLALGALLLCGAILCGFPAKAADALFSRDNLIAWCIVPFDSKKRAPEERAAMLQKLGFKHFAYDWRGEHIPTFDAEVEALKRHGVALDAFWAPGVLNNDTRTILDLLKRHKLTTQLWVLLDFGPDLATGAEQERRVNEAAKQLKPLADEANKIGSKLALYNHGGWFGEPENQLEIIAKLKEQGVNNVGLVYNLHHGHDHLDRFPALLEKIKPHLLSLNLNGSDPGGDKVGRKILPLGQGSRDLELLKVIQKSGYKGPIGILGHTMDDAEERLQDNLDGLDWLLPQLDGKPAGPAPKPRTPVPPAPPGAKAAAPAPPTDVPPLNPEQSQQVSSLLAEAKAHGDAVRGADVFADARFGCLSCHKVGRQGGTIGPDLSTVGRCVPHDQIIESLLWPGRTIKAGYAATIIALSDGKIVQGYKVAEDDKAISLREAATDTVLKVARADIEEIREQGTLMPDGLVASMTTQQRHDLARFLTELGGPGGAGAEARLEHAHTPVVFAYDKKPIRPELWPNAVHPVNRDRVYDFYAKEAEFAVKLPTLPALLPAYPGLDGGTYGHWGNQNEDTWKDARWNDSDLGTVLSGVYRGPDLVVPKSVCVRLGDKGEMAACFNPQTLCFEALWQGGFVRFSEVRHGFMEGLIPVGTMLPRPEGKAPEKDFRYHGFYRHGKRVVFSYRIGDVEMLDAPWVEDGKFTRVVGPAEGHPLAALTRGGSPQWPQVLETKGSLGTNRPYAVDTLSLPAKNPWNALFFIGDHDFFPDGTAMICTMQGDVWRVEGIDDTLEHVRWRRFATGIHQGLGLLVVDGKVHVLGRDQITRLHDLDGDGEADFHECVSNAYETSPGGHDFIAGLQRDAAGDFLTASSTQGVIRISPDGKTVKVIATGFRNPDGIGLSPDGVITIPCSEGEWTPSSMVCEIKQGGHYGYRGPKDGKTPDLPLVYLPRGLDNSSGGQVTVTSDRWGPLQGQMLHLSFGTGSFFLLLREQVDGQPQGAVVQMPGDFLSGVHRGRFNPKDGQLYVSGMTGWGSYTQADGCFQRVRYTGDPVQLPVAIHSHQNGVLLTFSSPIDPSVAALPKNQFAQVWNYRYGAAYGSQELSPRHPGMPGHDPLAIRSATVLDDGRNLFLEIPDLQPVNQLQLHLRVDAGAPHDIFATVNKLAAPFTGIPNYKPVEKTIAAHPILSDLAQASKTVPNPWRFPIANARPVVVEAGKNLTFATPTINVKAGEPIKLVFMNPDVVPHNWVLIKPGTLPKVGDLVNKIVADPDAVTRHYIPKTDDVIAGTDMVYPQDQFPIYFNAPAKPGRYPFLCTFPGHWMVMNGVMIVE
ncbi:DUF6797 domain-containing protein [Singulisphaera sp. PoT]|uniref:DUF6797 domain-containing protein n=1 Tax=Singulisphaera sp. PoT TaxID=3411797 RepID=UPI003BF4A09E